MNLGYEKAEDTLCLEGWRDNWIRTFRGDEIPEFSTEEQEMLSVFASNGKYSKLVIYLTHPKFGYELDSDMAEYVAREFIYSV